MVIRGGAGGMTGKENYHRVQQAVDISQFVYKKEYFVHWNMGTLSANNS